MILYGRSVIKGIAEGEAVVMKQPFNFGEAFYHATLSGSDKLVAADPRHELYGKPITGMILVYPTQHGSTGVSGSLMGVVKRGLGPKAMVCKHIDPMMAAGVIFSEKFLGCIVPTVDNLDKDPTEFINTGDYVRVDGDKGTVEVIKERA